MDILQITPIPFHAKFSNLWAGPLGVPTTAQNCHLVMPSIFMLLSFTQRLFVPCVRFIHSVSEVLMSPVSLGGLCHVYGKFSRILVHHSNFQRNNKRFVAAQVCVLSLCIWIWCAIKRILSTARYWRSTSRGSSSVGSRDIQLLQTVYFGMPWGKDRSGKQFWSKQLLGLKFYPAIHPLAQFLHTIPLIFHTFFLQFWRRNIDWWWCAAIFFRVAQEAKMAMEAGCPSWSS